MAEKLIAENRRARHDYQLLERFEAGIVLTGTEVKSLRDGRTTMAQAYADVRDGEAWLHGLEISIYDQGDRENHEPVRPRKLLLHRREIDSLYGSVREKGLTLVPTRLYFKDGRVKVELAVARGKEQRDKRRDVTERDDEASDGTRAQEPPLGPAHPNVVHRTEVHGIVPGWPVNHVRELHPAARTRSNVVHRAEVHASSRVDP